MNKDLSFRLLQKVMGWDAAQTEEEMPLANFMASMKYDSYDQYMPGTRYLASLIQWLNSFELTEREIVYNFIKENLVFISSTQMTYLVELLYNSYIKPELLKKVSERLNMPLYKIDKQSLQSTFKEEKRKSLIMGLSDGAHTDILRRSGGFSNEQVLTLYYPSGEKISEMSVKLQSEFSDQESPKFTSLYLIDDFTASGTSFIRYDEESHEFKGKLIKILKQFIETGNDEPEKGSIKNLLVENTKIDLNIYFCIATTYAVSYIRKNISRFLDQSKLIEKFDFHIEVVQILDENIKINENNCPKFYQIISKEKYFDSKHILTSSYKVGKHSKPFLGFNHGALPLVLSHNTPNNSLPVLWQYSDKFKGLFPRISRH